MLKDLYFTITAQWLEENKTKNGGHTDAQLSAVNVVRKNNKGWKNELIGKVITKKQKESFEKGKMIYAKSTLKRKEKDKLRARKKFEETYGTSKRDFLRTMLGDF